MYKDLAWETINDDTQLKSMKSTRGEATNKLWQCQCQIEQTMTMSMPNWRSKRGGLSCFVQTVCWHFGYIWEELPSINKQANRRWITVDFRDIKISEFMRLKQGVQKWSHGASLLRAFCLKDLAAKTLGGEQVVPLSYPLAEVCWEIVCKIDFLPFSWQKIANRRWHILEQNFWIPWQIMV